MNIPQDLYIDIRGSRPEEALQVAVEEGLTFGRSRDNRCCIKEDQISRFHAEVVRESGRWTLREMGAKNPILVRVRGEEFRLRDRGSCPLEPGLEFTLGLRRCFVREGRPGTDNQRTVRRDPGRAPIPPIPSMPAGPPAPAPAEPARPRDSAGPPPAKSPPAKPPPAKNPSVPPPPDPERTEDGLPPWRSTRTPPKDT